MKKAELIERLVSEHDVPSKAEAERRLNAVLETIEHGLKTDGKVEIHGFGTFQIKERAARKGRNPQTGDEIIIPATKKVGFKAAKKLNESVVQ